MEVFNDFANEEHLNNTEDNKWKILVVDDNEAVHKATIFALKNFHYKNRGIELLRAFNNMGAKAHLESHPDIAVVLLDVVMDESGLKLIPVIKNNPETQNIQIILRTGEPEEAPEREVVEKYEINDYIAKSEATQNKLFTSITSSLRAFENLNIIEQQKNELKRVNSLLKEQNHDLSNTNKKQKAEIDEIKSKLLSKELEAKIGTNFIGVSKKITQVRDKAKNLARFDECVLVTGENGSGKEIIAHLIHYESNRKDEKFLAFNCTAIAESLIESVLFGYKKGAFTGAVKDHDGYFKSAENGTLFIDEIGEMDMNAQVKLLRAIEYSEIIPVGSNTAEKINVRIIAATNKDLLDQVKKGLFREDLYYRIATSVISIPPLRERTEDITPLVEHFANTFAEKYNILPPEVDEDAMNFLRRHPFPGNVRELKNMVYNAIMNSGGNSIGIDDFASATIHGDSIPNDNTMEAAIRQAKKSAILKAKSQSEKGKAEEICEILKISRANYYRYLKELDI
ncbi:MAG: hypothetical protein C0594_05355 [Marinilabiliales bacterium]|nr:MAG: hypothetical protein C0594_05355 [Marinilabiliales bacterium]